MQSFICFISLATLIAVTSSASVGSLQELVPENVLDSFLEASANFNTPLELVRSKKSAYGGGASNPAPPCPKAYLFSCQSNVAPVPCAPAPAPAKPSYAGAYSMPVPSYAYPQEAHQGYRQDFVMPSVYGYNNQYLY